MLLKRTRNINFAINWSISLTFLLIGFVIFSPFQSYLFIEVLGLPLTIPEILILPFVPFLRRYLGIRLSKEVFNFLLAALLLVLIALIVDQFPVYSILSTFRSYLYLFIVFVSIKNRSIPSRLEGIFMISIGSTLAWAILSYASFKGVIAYGRGIAVYGNMLTLGMAILIPVIFNYRLGFVFALVFNIVISVFAGLRRQIAITLISLLYSLVLKMFRSMKSIVIFLLIIVLSVPGIVKAFQWTLNSLHDNSPIIYSRIVTKTAMMFSENKSESDESRLSNFIEIKNNLHQYILPRGFVSKRTMADGDLGAYMDIPVKEILHTFGIVISFVLLLLFLVGVRFHFKNFIRYKTRESACMLGMSVIIVVLFFIEGSFLNFTYTVPITGLIFGRIMSRRNLVA